MHKPSLKNRTYCDCLTEIRVYLETFEGQKLTEVRHSVILSLIEELQTYGNRLEAALYDHKDVLQDFGSYVKLKREIRRLESKKRKLKGDR